MSNPDSTNSDEPAEIVAEEIVIEEFLEDGTREVIAVQETYVAAPAEVPPVFAAAPTTVVVMNNTLPLKSVPASVILAIFFGPLGLLYASVKWALILLAINVVIILPLALLTLGLGLFLYVFTGIAAIVLSVTEVNKYNLAITSGSSVSVSHSG